jgi:hypothetical protein
MIQNKSLCLITAVTVFDVQREKRVGIKIIKIGSSSTFHCLNISSSTLQYGGRKERKKKENLCHSLSSVTNKDLKPLVVSSN